MIIGGAAWTPLLALWRGGLKTSLSSAERLLLPKGLRLGRENLRFLLCKGTILPVPPQTSALHPTLESQGNVDKIEVWHKEDFKINDYDISSRTTF